MYPYIPHTPEDERQMLEKIGVEKIEDLFKDIPENVALKRELSLEESKSELEVAAYLSKMAEKNCSLSELTCFLGAGAYDHYIPSVVDYLISRGEFYTSYTPYQPEISQGTLQYLFEYQTLIANLTEMDLANASLYDGGTAIAEAMLMAVSVSKKNKVLVSQTVRPESRKILNTYAKIQGIEVEEVKMKDGSTDLDDLQGKINDQVGAVIVQNPNFFGIIEDIEKTNEIVHGEKKANLIVSVDPISLGILKTPGEIGVDIVVGEGQSMGIPLSFGGPYLGFLAASNKFLRKIPGRIVGETVDLDGKRSYVLTLTAREQHIRREKATSNICSNQGLNTLAATIYMVTMGKEGIREVALQSAKKAYYTYEKMIASGKYKPLFDKPFFKEFAITSDKGADLILSELRKEKIIGGYHLGIDYPQYENSLLYAVTEKRSKAEIHKLVDVLEGI